MYNTEKVDLHDPLERSRTRIRKCCRSGHSRIVDQQMSCSMLSCNLGGDILKRLFGTHICAMLRDEDAGTPKVLRCSRQGGTVDIDQRQVALPPRQLLCQRAAESA